MPPVVAGGSLFSHLLERPIALEGPQQFVMAASRIVKPRHDRVDDTQLGIGRDPLRGDTFSGCNPSVDPCRVLECPHDRRANRHDPPASMLRLSNERCSRSRNGIGLVEGKPRVQLRIAGRRDASRVSDGRKLPAA